MPEPPSKLKKLEKLLAAEPDDEFLLYAIGMEHKNLSNWQLSEDFFLRLIRRNPSHAYAYYQLGQVRLLRGDSVQARQAMVEGLEAARRSGDAKAANELQAAMDELDAS